VSRWHRACNVPGVLGLQARQEIDMKGLLGIGIILLVVGAALMVAGSFTYKDTDPVIDLGKVEITKTTTKERRIPMAVSGTVMGVGAALTVAGAMKKGH